MFGFAIEKMFSLKGEPDLVEFEDLPNDGETHATVLEQMLFLGPLILLSNYIFFDILAMFQFFQKTTLQG